MDPTSLRMDAITHFNLQQQLPTDQPTDQPSTFSPRIANDKASTYGGQLIRFIKVPQTRYSSHPSFSIDQIVRWILLTQTSLLTEEKYRFCDLLDFITRIISSLSHHRIKYPLHNNYIRYHMKVSSMVHLPFILPYSTPVSSLRIS